MIKHYDELLNTNDKVFYNFLIKEDLLSKFILNKDEVIDKSIIAGIEESNRLKRDFNKDDIGKILEKFSLKFKYEETNNEYNFYELAAFEYPDTIILFESNINRIKSIIEKYKLEEFKDINISDIIISHEIYHKIEELTENIYTNSVYVENLNLGFLKRKSKLSSPSEIGAMAFSKDFLDLQFNPVLLNYLLAYSFDKEKIIYTKILGENNEG